jgi:hypothetical protein
VTSLDTLYREDFYAWALNQAEELRRLAETRPNAAIDFEHLIEEVEGLATGNLNTVLSQLTGLLRHLLKLEHSPSQNPRRQWLNTVDDARDEIRRHLTGAMRSAVERELDALYRTAARAARRDLLDYHEDMAARAVPAENPYLLEQLTDPIWHPANRHGLIDDD